MSETNSLKQLIKENFKKNRIVVFVFFFIWFVIIALTLFSNSNVLGKQSIGNEASQNYVELNKNTEIEQLINVEEIDSAKSFGIKFATYARINSGDIYVSVRGKKSNYEYLNEVIDALDVQDNDFYVFDLNTQLDFNKDDYIAIKLTSNSLKGNGVGIYFSNDKAFKESSLIINNSIQNGDLSTRFLVDNNELKLFSKVIIIWVTIVFSLIILLILFLSPKYEIIFTIFTLVLGLTYWIIITPMSVPDETVHYEYSFQLSNKLMGQKDYRIFDQEYQNYSSFAGHYNISAAYKRLVEKINKPLKLDNKNVQMDNDIDNSYITPFIPQALGITVARLLKLNMLKTFYLGRLFNLIFYVICVYIAIKNTPIHKLLFGIIATLPIFIQQAASFSYDCSINGLIFIVLSFVLKWKYQKEIIKIKDIIFVLIVNILLAPIKVVYGLFTFLFWFVPMERFGSKKKKIIWTLLLTAPAMYELIVLLSPLIFRAIRKLIENISSPKENSEVVKNKINNINVPKVEQTGNNYNYAPSVSKKDVYSFSDVINNPLEAIVLFARTIRYNIKIWFYGAFGRTLSGNTLVLPLKYVYLLIAVVLFSSFREELYIEPISFKVVSFVLCIFVGLMMLGGMLISWTPINQEIIDAYGGPIIQGMQGRYFSPLLPFCFVAFNNRKIRISKRFDKYALFIYLLLSFEVIIYILAYTFVN